MARRPANGMERESLWRQEIERRLRALESTAPGGFSADGTTTFLRSGRDLEVTGGDIIIDGGRVIAGPTTMNASGVSVGPTTLNASGLQVGSNVLVNSTGLHVAGGLVQAVWADVAEELSENDSINSDPIDNQEVNSYTIDPPNWVQSLFVVAFGSFQVTQNTVQDIVTRARVDAGGPSAVASTNTQHKHDAGVGQTSTVTTMQAQIVPLSPAGRAVVCKQYSRVSTGTSTSNRSRLTIVAIGVRSAFT